jgi:hypothetical protein
MALWRYGVMALWRYGVMALWRYAISPLCQYAIIPCYPSICKNMHNEYKYIIYLKISVAFLSDSRKLIT